MENVHKIFILLEKLKFDQKKDAKYIENHLEIIKKYMNFNLDELINLDLLKQLKFPQLVFDSGESGSDCFERNSLQYLCYLMYICLTIKNNMNFDSADKDDLISIHNLEILTKTVQEIIEFSSRLHLPIIFQQHEIFKNHNNQLKIMPNMNLLGPTLRFNFEILQIDMLSKGKNLDTVILDGMAAAFTLISQGSSKDSTKLYDIEFANEYLIFLYKSKNTHIYFRNLLILKGIKYMPIQKILHRDLLEKLQDENGFSYLVDAITGNISDNLPNWKCFEVIANIVAHKGHTKEFYENIIEQIFTFLKKTIPNRNLHGYLPAGVVSLKKMIQLDKILRNQILKNIENLLKIFIEPPDLLVGVILMENNEIINLFELLNFIFCDCSIDSLPSELLINYLPLLIGIQQNFPEIHSSYQKINKLLLYCLSNRNKDELKEIIQFLIFDAHSENRKYFHSRITFILNEKLLAVNAQIAPTEFLNEINYDIASLLIKSNNNPLIYNCFIAILKLLDTHLMENSSGEQIDLLQDQEEFDEFLTNKFRIKFSLINSLTNIIEFKPFHSQFHENPREMLEFIENLLLRRINDSSAEDDIISISLAIFQEIVESSRDQNEFKKFINLLKRYFTINKNEAIKMQINNLLDLLEGRTFKYNSSEPSKYKLARKLIEENQPHLRVYGIEQMNKLIRDKDEEILANKHSVLAMALYILRDEESYTFLNCVRLFVQLIDILEAEIFETLSAEYLNKNENYDYRLKIGEAIVKVTETIGQLSFKYRNTLLNCFINGCKDSREEFRCSSLSNLGTMCRLLTYQVYNFFQELLHLIESIMQTEKYLPARRAAILILYQLLWGVESLIDFEEYLLPIYRLLKNIVENDPDQVSRVHATNGLKILSEKCKSFLLPELKMEREIKISGINRQKKVVSILEIN